MSSARVYIIAVIINKNGTVERQ